VRSLEFGAGSQINAPIAILIWLMITPMMKGRFRIDPQPRTPAARSVRHAVCELAREAEARK
jgi:hypothetical protein